MDKKKRQAKVKGATAPGTGKGRKPKPEPTGEGKSEQMQAIAESNGEAVTKLAMSGALPKLPAIKRANRTSKPKPTKPCMCGCETPTKGDWAPGHDSRAKGWAIRVERGIVKLSEVPANEQAGAKFMLKARKEEGGKHGTAGKIRLHKGKTTETSESVAEQVSDPAVGE